MPWWPLYIIGSAVLLVAIKCHDPARHRSIYYRTKGRRE